MSQLNEEVNRAACPKCGSHERCTDLYLSACCSVTQQLHCECGRRKKRLAACHTLCSVQIAVLPWTFERRPPLLKEAIQDGIWKVEVRPAPADYEETVGSVDRYQKYSGWTGVDYCQTCSDAAQQLLDDQVEEKRRLYPSKDPAEWGIVSPWCCVDFPEVRYGPYHCKRLCRHCGWESPFVWTQPDSRGEIVPEEADFDPFDHWPEPKVLESWAAERWIEDLRLLDSRDKPD